MKHPENLEDTNSIKITDSVKDVVKVVSTDIEQARADRGTWEQRQDDYYRKRFGLRKKRNFPWAGYPNYILPLIDSDIQKAKPAYVNAAYGVSPIVTYEPFGPEDIAPARKREQLLDFRIKNKMDFFRPYVLGIDKLLQTGFVVFKIVWKFSTRSYTDFLNVADLPKEVVDALYAPETTDVMLKKILQEEFDVDLDFEENEAELNRGVAEFREGVTEFKFTFTEKEDNKPEMIACDPREDLTVPIDTQDIQDARWIDYRFYSTLNDIKISMRDGKYKKHSEDDLRSWAGKDSNQGRNQDRDFREGISETSLSDDVVLLHETCLWYDINGDGILERCIATWPDNNPSQVLRFIELPYSHGMWPYVQVQRELVDFGFYSSRGIPALDDDFQTGISASFNNDLANQLIVNTPFIKYVKGAVSNIKNRRFVPGEAVEVRDMGGTRS